MKQQPKALFRLVQEAYTELSTVLCETYDGLEHEPDVEECVDIGYVLREVEGLIDELRKQCRKTQRSCHHRIGALWSSTPTADDRIRTAHCSAKINVKQTLSPPTLKKDREQYLALMVNYLGIDPQIVEEHEVVRPHFPGLCNLITAKMAAGQPLPEGIDPNRVSSSVEVSFVRKKGILE